MGHGGDCGGGGRALKGPDKKDRKGIRKKGEATVNGKEKGDVCRNGDLCLARNKRGTQGGEGLKSIVLKRKRGVRGG